MAHRRPKNLDLYQSKKAYRQAERGQNRGYDIRGLNVAFKSLRDFIKRLEREGRLARVTEPISTVLEMTEIQTRLLAEHGPAVLFENVIGQDGKKYDTSVLVNLFGTVERVAWAMEREPSELRELGKTLAFLRQPEPPGGWKEAVSMLPLIKTAMGHET